MSTIACVSMFADPIHVGHLELLERSKQMADKLYVIVNNDKQACLKKGSSFMKDSERLAIVRSIKYVDAAILSVDDDETVAKTIEIVCPTYFCNGGDVTNESLPLAEKEACDRCGTKLVDGLGKKIQSSRNLTGLYPLKEQKESRRSPSKRIGSPSLLTVKPQRFQKLSV